MKFSFHPEAETELFATIDWYEQQEPGLGQSFSDEVVAAIVRIIDFPTAWPFLHGDIRRCLTNRFPFGVLYTVDQNEIYILSIMHLRRKPGFWMDRIE